MAKIHRDLLLAPKSDTDGTAKLEKGWASVLQRLFRENTPIVIGYGGNDGSLMGFLESLEPGFIPGGIYWCYRKSDGPPSERIQRIVSAQKGKLIPILGFDELMLMLGDGLKFDLLAEAMERQSKERVDHYRRQVTEFRSNLERSAAKNEREVRSVKKALTEAVAREESWWAWEQKAQQEPDPDKRESLYRQGLQQFPKSAELTGNFALFVHDVRKDYDEAERLYRLALELDPEDADYVGNFAVFVHDVRKDYDEAERLYRLALELDPNDAENVGNFALFVHDVRKDYDEAERLYRLALDLDPKDARNVGNFAEFLLGTEAFDEGKKYLSKAWRLNDGRLDTIAALIALHWCLLARIEGREASPGLGRLKYQLTQGDYEEGSLSLPSFETLLKKLPEDEVPFYSALAEALLDPTKIGALDGYDQWTQVEPVPLDQEWKMFD